MLNGIRVGFTFFFLLANSMAGNAESLFENVRIIGGVSGGYTTFDFPAKLDHEIHFPSGEIVLAATRAQWQIGINGTFSVIEAEISEEEDTGNASRYDLDLTIGYKVNDQWSVFGGYKDGETEIDFSPRESGMATSESYAQDGPYIGASYSWRFERAGSLNFSVAYALLDATNNFSANTDEPEEGEALEFDDLTGLVTGETSGFSYAATWTMPLSSNLLYQSRLKVNDYRQDITQEGVKFEGIGETLTRLSLGIAYVF